MLMNKLMAPFYRKEFVDLKLPIELKDILSKGFKEVGDGVFFLSTHADLDTLHMDFIRKFYMDISGYESSLNRIHIDDYVSENVIDVSILFIMSFVDLWKTKYPGRTCIAVLSLQVDDEDRGEMASFTFYVSRNNEDVIECSNLDSYMQPMLVEIIAESAASIGDDTID